MMIPFTQRGVFYYFVVLFLLCTAIHIRYVVINIDGPITDRYGFRQTQTAISTYFLIQDGLTVNYPTPVLGKPWSIPMEFPLYQWLTALAVKFTHIPLDTAGRLVSLFFFYIGLIAVWYLFAMLGIPAALRLLPISLMLICPLFLFWSRTFMIESTALAFGMAHLAALAAYRKQRRRLFLLPAALFGVVSSLVKITTYFVFAVCVFLNLCRESAVHLKRYRGKGGALLLKDLQLLVPYGAVLAVSGAAGILWAKYADRVKTQNPLADDFLTSNALSTWNFGTLGQRFSSEFQSRGMDWIAGFITGSRWVFLILLIAPFVNRKYLPYMLITLAAFLSGPLVFSNLYYHHEYYYYAVGAFLLFAFSFACYGFIQVERTRNAALFFLIPLLAYNLFHGYRNYYLPIQHADHTIHKESLLAGEFTKPNDVLLIYDQDWDSTTPYYARRRSIMNRWNYPIDHEKMAASLAMTGQENIAALIRQNPPPDFIAALGFPAGPVYKNLYLREDRRKSAFRKRFLVDIQTGEPPGLRMTTITDTLALVHEPKGYLHLPLSGKNRFEAGFGIMESLAEGGVAISPLTFSICGFRKGTKGLLYRRVLDPVHLRADAGIQRVSLDVSEMESLSLEATPSSRTDVGTPFWIQIEVR